MCGILGTLSWSRFGVLEPEVASKTPSLHQKQEDSPEYFYFRSLHKRAIWCFCKEDGCKSPTGTFHKHFQVTHWCPPQIGSHYSCPQTICQSLTYLNHTHAVSPTLTQPTLPPQVVSHSLCHVIPPTPHLPSSNTVSNSLAPPTHMLSIPHDSIHTPTVSHSLFLP